ncbi:hypothetical protein PGT21_026373 [Puccinia graminis f. sp. tritici]|uniref:Uncharacterized protein n=1 Tax=Puccinia graminis f. sp. tritici TaxID=56615 RepID=A0A5B0QNX2_PUCGR|nr:hypothetical protein PGT21_026373 [Puccinia graminis f. sp. tritici]
MGLKCGGGASFFISAGRSLPPTQPRPKVYPREQLVVDHHHLTTKPNNLFYPPAPTTPKVLIKKLKLNYRTSSQ